MVRFAKESSDPFCCPPKSRQGKAGHDWARRGGAGLGEARLIGRFGALSIKRSGWSRKGLTGSDDFSILPMVPQFTMITSRLCASAILLGAVFTLLAMPERKPPTDKQALLACLELHPERYCRLQHAPSTVSALPR